MAKEIRITEDEIKNIKYMLDDTLDYCQSEDDEDNAIDCIERTLYVLRKWRSRI